MKDIWTIILDLLIFIAIVAAAYYTAKHLSRRGMKPGKSRHMRVEDRLPLSRDKAVYLVRVGEEHYLIGASAQQLNLLGKPDLGELPEEEPPAAFADVLGRFTARKDKTQGAQQPKGFYPERIKKIWDELIRRKRENQQALKQYRMKHKKRKEEDE